MLDHFVLILSGFVGLNLIVLLNSSFLALRLTHFKVKNWSKLVLSIFLLFILQVLLSQILLGMSGQLNYLTVWLSHLTLLVIFSIIFIKKKPSKIVFPPIPQLNPTVFLMAS